MTEKSMQFKFKRFVEDAADKALAEVGLNIDGIQKLIENGDEFQTRIIVAIRELSEGNQFNYEEIASNYGYPAGYRKPKGITKQTKILRQLLPGIGYADEKIAQQPLPTYAEGWFAIPKWQLVGRTYNEAVEKVLELIKQQRNGKFYNCLEGKLGVQYLRRHERTAKKFEVLAEQQKGYDILVVAAQFGLRHRDRSVRRAREVFRANEVGLGTFEIGCMLLTHPERLQNCDDLWVECPGNEYAPDADCDFSYAPCFGFTDGRVGFGASWIGYANDRYGSASGFLPQ